MAWLSPEPGNKLQMGYKSIMRTDESVSESFREYTEGRCKNFHFILSLKRLKTFETDGWMDPLFYHCAISQR